MKDRACTEGADDVWVVERYKDRRGRPRLRVRAANGEIVMQGTEDYSSARARDKTARRATEVKFVLET